MATDSYDTTRGLLSWDRTNDARTVVGSGTPFTDGRIWTVKGSVLGHCGTPAIIIPQLFKNPPISVITVGCVRVNPGPGNWVLDTTTPPEAPLNCVLGDASPNELTIEKVPPCARPISGKDKEMVKNKSKFRSIGLLCVLILVELLKLN
jgi:hypothetical protein